MMNKNTSFHSRLMILCLFFLGSINMAFAQNTEKPYFQQKVNTYIEVTLDDVNHKLNGTIEIDYKNNSPEILEEIYIHLWGNAYKDRTTAFAKQQLKNNSKKFHYADDEKRGNFEDIQFKINGKDVSYSYYQDNPDIAYIKLPFGLKPGESMLITTPLNLKIPASFSRLGHVGTSYQMTQWFPKPAVYDRDGWHPMPYLNQGEFYSEFGNYDVSITLPENYVVASTGELQNESERQFLEQKIEETKARAQDSIRDLSFPESSENMKTIRYVAKNVHDFGWFADKRFYVEKGNVKLSNGNIIDTWVFYTDTEKDMWQDALGYVNRSVEFYSEKVGNYPYPHATAVQSALSAGGGMEYPMITVIGQMGEPQSLDAVITHEVGHNWFYGILGFNERDHPWLDEGFNSYYDHRYDQLYYDSPPSMGLPKFLTKNASTGPMHTILRAQIIRGKDQPPSLHSADFESFNYFIGCYEKPAIAIEFLEQYLGADKFDMIMQSLYKEWEFKHPGPDDVIAHFNNKSGEDLSWFFDGFIRSNDEVNYKISSISKVDDKYKIKVKNKGDIKAPYPITAYKKDQAVETQWYESTKNAETVEFPIGDYDYFIIDSSFTMLDINMDNNYKKSKGLKFPKIGFITGADQARKKQLFIIPALGANAYDGFMLGLGLHNLTLPMPRLKFNMNSMYGFSSGSIVGTARLQYDQPVKKGALNTISYKIGSKQFSLKEIPNSENNPNYGTIVPEINFHFIHGNNSAWSSDLNIKNTFVRINKTGFTDENGNPVTNIDNSFTKLEYSIVKSDALYPMAITAGVEYMNYVTPSFMLQRKDAVKVDLALSQVIEYMKGKTAKARIYTGFMPVTPDVSTTLNNNTFGGSNANINLIYNSYADHAYEDFFFGRQIQNGFSGAQVVAKDGAFKLPGIDPSNLGQSDRFAYAVNLSSDIPIKKVPNYIKLYFDYGAFMINRTTTTERKFESIYSGGIMLNFIDAINIYFPLVNSDNIVAAQGGNYFNRIGFTFDLNKLDIIDLYNNFRF